MRKFLARLTLSLVLRAFISGAVIPTMVTQPDLCVRKSKKRSKITRFFLAV